MRIYQEITDFNFLHKFRNQIMIPILQLNLWKIIQKIIILALNLDSNWESRGLIPWDWGRCHKLSKKLKKIV